MTTSKNLTLVKRVLAASLCTVSFAVASASPAAAATSSTSSTAECAKSGYWTGYWKWTWDGKKWTATWMWVWKTSTGCFTPS